MPHVLRNSRASPDIPDDAALGVKGRTNSCLLCFMSFCGQRDIPQGNGVTDLFSLFDFPIKCSVKCFSKDRNKNPTRRRRMRQGKARGY